MESDKEANAKPRQDDTLEDQSGNNAKKPANELDGNGSTGRWHAGDFVGGVLFFAVSVFAIVASLGMPNRGGLGFITSPGFTPLLVGSLTAILSSIVLFNAIRGRALFYIKEWLKSDVINNKEFRRSAVVIILLIAYVALMGKLDFGVDTFLYSLVTLLYVRAGKLWQILLYAVLITALVAYFIPYMFSMPVP
jgi:hypothetical protein